VVKKRTVVIVISVALVLLALLAVGIALTAKEKQGSENLSDAMRDAVLHEDKKVNLFGLSVNPGLISAYIITAALLLFAAIVRIFAIPRFKMVPGKFQLIIEEMVGLFKNMAKDNSPHMNGFLGGYIFSAGCYIFISTLFELVGVQVKATTGHPITLPVPLSDINGAIALGCMSYIVILSGGLFGNGIKGVGNALKDFSLPISMSFRLFGALLSGVLVTELLYHSFALSIGVPVLAGVLFTLLHALIQAYVLTTLTSIFYGEAAEPSHNKTKKEKKAIL